MQKRSQQINKTLGSPVLKLDDIVQNISNKEMSEPSQKGQKSEDYQSNKPQLNQSRNITPKSFKQGTTPIRKKSIFQQIQEDQSNKKVINNNTNDDKQLSNIHKSLFRKQLSEDWSRSIEDEEIQQNSPTMNLNLSNNQNNFSNKITGFNKSKGKVASFQRIQKDGKVLQRHKSKSIQMTHEKEKRYDIAVQYYSQAYNYFNSTKNKRSFSQVIYICISMAECYLILKKYSLCQGLLEEAKQKLKQINEIKDINVSQIKEFEGLESIMYQQLGNQNGGFLKKSQQLQQTSLVITSTCLLQNATQNIENQRELPERPRKSTNNRFHDSFIELQSPMFFRLAMQNPSLLQINGYQVNGNRSKKTSEYKLTSSIYNSSRNINNGTSRKIKRGSTSMVPTQNSSFFNSSFKGLSSPIKKRPTVSNQTSIDKNNEIEEQDEEDMHQQDSIYRQNPTLIFDLNKNQTFKNRFVNKNKLRTNEQTNIHKSEMNPIEEELRDMNTPTSTQFDTNLKNNNTINNLNKINDLKLPSSNQKPNLLKRFQKGLYTLFMPSNDEKNNNTNPTNYQGKIDEIPNQKRKRSNFKSFTIQNQTNTNPKIKIFEPPNQKSQDFQMEYSNHINHSQFVDENNYLQISQIPLNSPQQLLSETNLIYNQRKDIVIQIKEPQEQLKQQKQEKKNLDKQNEHQFVEVPITNINRIPSPTFNNSTPLKPIKQLKIRNKNSTIIPEIQNQLQQQLINKQKQELFLPYSILWMKLNLIQGKLYKSQGPQSFLQAATFFVEVLEYKESNPEDDQYDPEDKISAMKELLSIFQTKDSKSESNQIQEEITRIKSSSITRKKTGRPFFFIDSFM